MFPGKLIKLQFKYFGASIEAILDRLPTASATPVSNKDDEFIVEAEVYGNGILMWLLSQGNKVEVLKPKSVRDEMKSILTEMLSRY